MVTTDDVRRRVDRDETGTEVDFGRESTALQSNPLGRLSAPEPRLDASE